MDMTHEGFISIDLAHNIVLFNKAAKGNFGYGAHEALGSPLDTLIPDQCRGIVGQQAI